MADAKGGGRDVYGERSTSCITWLELFREEVDVKGGGRDVNVVEVRVGG